MKYKARFGVIAISLLLLGCASSGGGGSTTITPSGGGSPPPPPPPPPPPSADSFRTPEYNRMGALDQIHAADAYALGYTGQGVTIGIVDFNFNLSSSEVNFAPGSVGPNATALAIYQAQIGQAAPTDQHGQAVATVAAGIKNDVGIQGVAFNSTVLAVDFFSDVNETQIIQGGAVYHVSDPWTYITSRGVRIINTSFGYEAGDVISNPPVVHDYYVLQSAAKAVANGALLVASAGNAGGANPSQSNLDIISDFPSFGVTASSPGAFIIAGAVDSSNNIASFSDRAGSAMNYYMVAPGVNIVFPWNGTLYIGSGTSFSAPLIAGAAAIVMQRWPTLTAHQVADILFASATDLGAPGVDPIYGHGLLNVVAALQPIGTTTILVSGANAPPVAGSAVVLAPMFGDARALRAALANVTILDSFRRDFQADLSPLVSSRPAIPDLFDAIEQRLAWRNASLPVSANASLAFELRRDRADAIVPSAGFAGPQPDRPFQTVFRLSGSDDGLGWTVGRGLSLSSALATSGLADPFANMSLTGLFSPMTQNGIGNFATVSLPFESSALSMGIYATENQGQTGRFTAPFRDQSEAVAARLESPVGSNSQVAVELGVVSDTGGMFGSLASGGLKMGDRSSSAWLSTTFETPLSSHWYFESSLTLMASGASHPQGSVIDSIGPVLATSFAIGLARTDLFGAGDSLRFAAGQPLRAEVAPIAIVSGVGRDSTGALLMGFTRSSLAASGRELDVESGYRFPIGDWLGEADAAYRFDADNVRHAQAVVAVLTLSRRF
jgi:hypothetical protein